MLPSFAEMLKDLGCMSQDLIISCKAKSGNLNIKYLNVAVSCSGDKKIAVHVHHRGGCHSLPVTALCCCRQCLSCEI